MSSKLNFIKAHSEEDYQQAWPLIKILNSNLSSNDYWLYVAEMKACGNYELYLAFMGEAFVGICGCWIATKFYTGKYLEIDNFIIHPEYQNLGFGTEFMNFIERHADSNDCKTIMLDAYLENKGAHKFYERHAYTARGFHFIKKIGDN
jgi:ribosomal protein S18 acetylase RimI-like enzyme